MTLDTDLENVFKTLASRWKRDTGHISAPEGIYFHQSYQMIIGMGKEALPFIFKDLRTKNEDWFWALEVITREQPVPRRYAGRIDKLREYWLKWADKQGY